MKKYFILAVFSMLLAACGSTVNKVELSSLTNKGAVIGAVSLNRNFCMGALGVKRILSKNPMTLDTTLHLLETKGTWDVKKLLTNSGASANPTFLDAGEYAAVVVNCRVQIGNTTVYVRHGGLVEPIAFFNVNKGELINIGMLNLTPEYKGVFIFRSFSRFAMRNVMPLPPSVIENFIEQNPEFKDRVVERPMVAVPIMTPVAQEN